MTDQDRASDELYTQICTLVHKCLSQEAEPAEIDELERLVCEDAQARKIYVALMHETRGLRRWAAGARPASPDASAQDTDPGNPERTGPLKKITAGLKGLARDFARESVALAVIVLVMVSGGVLIWNLSQMGPPQPIVQQPDAPVEPFDNTVPQEIPNPKSQIPNAIVARVTGTRDATWGNGAWTIDREIRAGQRLSLKQGLVEIAFESGASIILEGPAELEVGSRKSEVGSPRSDLQPSTLNACSLTLGKLFARVPPQATGFSVHTPTMKIVDLGTEFGVEVKPEVGSRKSVHSPTSDLRPPTSTSVQVFRGLVEVQSQIAQAPEAARVTEPIRLKEGQGLTNVPGDQRPREIQVDESHFVRDLPSPPPVAAWPKDSPLQPGDIVVATAQSDLKLVKIDPKSGNQSVLAEGTAAPVQQGDWWMSLACAPDGTVLVGTSETGHAPPRIMKFDPRDGKMSVLATVEKDVGTGGILGLAVAHDGSIIAIVGDRIVRLDAAGGRQTTLARLGGGHIRTCLDAGGRDLLIASMLKQSVSLLRGNEIIPWVEGAAVGRPLAVAVRGDGRVFVTSELGTKLTVLEIERGAGHAVRAVADLPEAIPSGGVLVGMATETDGKLIVSSSSHPFSVYRVDVDRGTVTALAQGGELVLPIAMAVVPGAPVEPVVDPSKTKDACLLNVGKPFACVPKKAHGFTVHTPGMSILDLGMQFGVEVQRPAQAEVPRTQVEVFEGKMIVDCGLIGRSAPAWRKQRLLPLFFNPFL